MATGCQIDHGISKLKKVEDLHHVLMTAKEFVVLDIETTGFSIEKAAEIIEIGAVLLDGETGRIKGRFSQFIQPAHLFGIPKKIEVLTHISWDTVKDQPFFEDVLPSFAHLLGDRPVVAHNASFDWYRFLYPYFLRVGHHATNEVICSMRLAQFLYPGLSTAGYSLDALYKAAGLSMENHTDAFADAVYTAQFFAHMLQDYRRLYRSRPPRAEDIAVPNPLPSSIPYADLRQLKIRRINYYPGRARRMGGRIYVSTNMGRLYYSERRHLWSGVELWCRENIPVREWGHGVLNVMGIDQERFVHIYGSPAQQVAAPSTDKGGTSRI